ncbi:hypothetical protein SEA_ZITCH_72 [Gordonia Phage Zitch]|uniref:Uncharacterized protein n=1 Tax=Gordonia Phage Zitch TaxID=2743909 RepID=A0A7G3WHW5_9CAUD|nr:hypothetical protein J1774_gp72 [Gordonia Phage Zitch]QKY78517.1 hypothetical protein SEA_ZITCH_72 [Gordonia Phage Zitch]
MPEPHHPPVTHDTAWVARLLNTDAGAELVIMRLDLTNPDPEQHAKFAEPPAGANSWELINPNTNERLAFMTVAHLKAQVDTQRPVLQIATIGLSAFPLPNWTIEYATFDPDDLLDGILVTVYTPADVILNWTDITTMPGTITPADVLGDRS